ncbi:MAG: hypothetical protein NVSMB30_01790 [Hymenobacter sp.]
MAAPVPVTIDQRFAQLIQQFGLTKNSFAISLGKTASVVQHLIDGRNKPGYDLLCKVFEIYPNVSRDWLLLGRGPMLVSGEHAARSVSPASAPAPELPLEPIDLADIEVPAPRRPGPGVAGSRLQPAEIAATLALAAAANQPAARPTEPADTISPAPAKEIPWASVQPVAGPAAEVSETLPKPELGVGPGVSSPSPEVYVTAALQAQHLQHQLAMAELRNQHLLDQQQLLREMLAMARQTAG